MSIKQASKDYLDTVDTHHHKESLNGTYKF